MLGDKGFAGIDFKTCNIHEKLVIVSPSSLGR